MKEICPTPIEEFLLEWSGVGTGRNLSISEALKPGVGKRTQLGH